MKIGQLLSRYKVLPDRVPLVLAFSLSLCHKTTRFSMKARKQCYSHINTDKEEANAGSCLNQLNMYACISLEGKKKYCNKSKKKHLSISTAEEIEEDTKN